VTYSAEFIVNVGQYEHVKLTIEGQDFKDAFVGRLDTDGNLADYGTVIGDYYASLKAAILHGRDQALNAARAANETIKPIEKLITEELDAKVLDVTEHATQKPWERPVEAVPVKPWDVAVKQAGEPAQRGLEDF
jgi:hypothetical protein